MPVTIDYRCPTQQYQSRSAYLPNGRRDIPGLMWADVLEIVLDILGAPVQFFTRDFLTTIVWPAAESELIVAFCSQGSRKGEVLLSMPAAAAGAAALLQQIGERIEARRAEIRQAAIDSGIPADYYDAEEEEEWR